jgi:hypothetical protein
VPKLLTTDARLHVSNTAFVLLDIPKSFGLSFDQSMVLRIIQYGLGEVSNGADRRGVISGERSQA